MVSQFSSNQPWKIQIKILEEDQDDLRVVLASPEFQMFQFAYKEEQTLIPFAISGKMLYKDQQVSLILAHMLTHLLY